jgi:callose synthase
MYRVERLFRDLNESIAQGSLLVTINLKKLQLVQSRLTGLTGLLIRDETADRAAGVTKALRELYEVVTHEFLAPNLREQFDTWQLLLRARNDGRLFSNIFWPKDLEMKEQVKRLHLLLTVKDSAANIPKNLEAQRRLQFFTNSLFMDMPEAKPVSEMIPFCVFTPYYSETVLYSMSELCVDNEDGISILFYLQKIFPGNIMTLISTTIATCYPHYLFFGFEQSFSYAPCFTFVLQVLACMSNWVPSQLVNGFIPSESC